MKNYFAVRTQPKFFSEPGTLALFGELFDKGYANGLVEEALNQNFKVIQSTVGRRDGEVLRPLNSEEIFAKLKLPLINVPLEAGFDLEKSEAGLSLVEKLKDFKLSDWQNFKISADELETYAKLGRERFKSATRKYLSELEALTAAGSGPLVIAHLMAGGVPRAKIIMPLMNRVFKGTDDRHLSSQVFWDSGIGDLCKKSFMEVTAETFRFLIEESAPLREKLKKQNREVYYLGYSYHGTEIFHDHKFRWQSYAPYLQGFAKMALENISREFSSQGLNTAVYNCPEILTNSSSIFKGVEVPLYPLITALEQQNILSQAYLNFRNNLKSLLSSESGFESAQKLAEDFLKDSDVKLTLDFESWPSHNNAFQMKSLLETSEKLIALHKDEKNLMTLPLSEVVFKACGQVMLTAPTQPVAWINHDVIAKLASSWNEFPKIEIS
jgi:hypothetical protein